MELQAKHSAAAAYDALLEKQAEALKRLGDDLDGDEEEDGGSELGDETPDADTEALPLCGSREGSFLPADEPLAAKPSSTPADAFAEQRLETTRTRTIRTTRQGRDSPGGVEYRARPS